MYRSIIKYLNIKIVFIFIIAIISIGLSYYFLRPKEQIIKSTALFEGKHMVSYIKDNKITLTWSIRDELKTPPIVTSNQIYIRFIGDRSINDKDFGKIVKDRKKDMTEYVDILKKQQIFKIIKT